MQQSINTQGCVLSERQVALVFVAYFLFFVSFVFLQTVVPPWSQKFFNFGAFETSLFFVGLGGVSVVTQAVILPNLSGKVSNSAIAFCGVILMTSGFLVLGTLTDLLFLVSVGALMAIGFGRLLTTLSTMASVNAPKEVQGGSLGMAWALAALAQAVGPTLAASAFVFGASSGFYGFAFILAAAVTLSIPPFLLYIRKH